MLMNILIKNMNKNIFESKSMKVHQVIKISEKHIVGMHVVNALLLFPTICLCRE